MGILHPNDFFKAATRCVHHPGRLYSLLLLSLMDLLKKYLKWFFSNTIFRKAVPFSSRQCLVVDAGRLQSCSTRRMWMKPSECLGIPNDDNDPTCSTSCSWCPFCAGMRSFGRRGKDGAEEEDERRGGKKLSHSVFLVKNRNIFLTCLLY